MATSYPPAIGRFNQVEGRRLWLHRSGTAGPAVVFLPGASAVGLDYLNVHDRVCAFTTSVLYDRGGTGCSDPVDLPRTAVEVATELSRLLRTEGRARPLPAGGTLSRRRLRAPLCPTVPRRGGRNGPPGRLPRGLGRLPARQPSYQGAPGPRQPAIAAHRLANARLLPTDVCAVAAGGRSSLGPSAAPNMGMPRPDWSPW